MPIIDSFEGIKVYIYGNDHNPPHFHAIYGEYEALIEIQNLSILRGDLPNRQLKKVVEWAENKQNDLLTIFQQLNPNLR
jgi:hypothetical protein